MRVTIVGDDNLVLVDGVPETVDCSALVAEGKHAVQWYDTFGEVEYRTDPETGGRAPNEHITDFSPYQPYVDAWEIEKNKPPPPPTPAAKAAVVEQSYRAGLERQADKQQAKGNNYEAIKLLLKATS